MCGGVAGGLALVVAGADDHAVRVEDSAHGNIAARRCLRPLPAPAARRRRPHSSLRSCPAARRVLRRIRHGQRWWSSASTSRLLGVVSAISSVPGMPRSSSRSVSHRFGVGVLPRALGFFNNHAPSFPSNSDPPLSPGCPYTTRMSEEAAAPRCRPVGQRRTIRRRLPRAPRRRFLRWTRPRPCHASDRQGRRFPRTPLMHLGPHSAGLSWEKTTTKPPPEGFLLIALLQPRASRCARWACPTRPARWKAA